MYNQFMTLDLLIENLPLILTDFQTISLVYLFGSQVTGQVGPMSDYDLAIFADSGTDEYDTQARFQYAVAKAMNISRVDIVLLDRAPIELAFQIIATGKLLYQRDTYNRVEFEAQVLAKYGDYLPTLRSFKDQILRGDSYAQRVQRYRDTLGRTRRAPGAARTSSRAKAR